MNTDNVDRNTSQFIIYQSEDGQTRLDVRFVDDSVWLTQALMAELFSTTPENVLMHLKNIFNEAELDQNSTTKDFLVVRQEGSRQVKRNIKHYNLDAIISVGYRVQSRTATRFRQWATRQLREYIVKGFLLDDERLKNPDQPFDYFEELTRRIQDIRTSEKRFYQKITDIYATSVDYDPTEDASIGFFKTVQNKVHWAITGQTAAEIILHRAIEQLEEIGIGEQEAEKLLERTFVYLKSGAEMSLCAEADDLFSLSVEVDCQRPERVVLRDQNSGEFNFFPAHNVALINMPLTQYQSAAQISMDELANS